MKLSDLDPRWCIGGGSLFYGRHGMGMSFLCPVHKNHRLAVMFSNPLDGQPRDTSARYCWLRTGDTFEVMTLGPSIDASGSNSDIGSHLGMIQTPCWHGYITNGVIC